MDRENEVFLLEHTRTILDCEHVKTIGIYSTQEGAQRAIKRLRLQPGFRDSPEGFCIDCYLLDMDGWTEGFVTVRHSPMEVEEEEQGTETE